MHNHPAISMSATQIRVLESTGQAVTGPSDLAAPSPSPFDSTAKPKITFSTLTSEIRCMIYEHLLVSPTGFITMGVRDHDKQICLDDWRWKLLAQTNWGSRFYTYLEWNPKHYSSYGLEKCVDWGCYLRPISDAIFRTSKAIRQESLAILGSRNTLSFQEPCIAMFWAKKKFEPLLTYSEPSLSVLKHIRHILIHVHADNLVQKCCMNELATAMHLWTYIRSLKSTTLEVQLHTVPLKLTTAQFNQFRKNFDARRGLNIANVPSKVWDAEWQSSSLRELVGTKSEVVARLAHVRNKALYHFLHGKNVTATSEAAAVRRRINVKGDFFRGPEWEEITRTMPFTGQVPSIMLEAWNVAYGGELWVDGVLSYKDGELIHFPNL
ncbi:hypothetical protein GLAREA_01016 [Glarea lozoyensis ATCC 20868]|uniref:Uncharacterized protein n=1 Tax=Glarea lozoyensis (strain ATCC 20868 / MF5171) TaxID=1116229 RepID=S3DCZ6_GLAL2|nr:uncharacterized protein GLAREA_01016 [Glarea lozoyensis ATCC 20868]EPE29856.1 hypothetical protein GLAREA_01016 [Glarea lozoyensis ATCC 20868]